VKVAVGCDHAGLVLKKPVLDALDEIGVEYKDFGSFSEDPVDYPDVAHQVACAVATGEYDRGILMCGTGVGMSIAANKIKGVRAASCDNTVTAQFARTHNDANVLAMGGRTVGPVLASAIVKEFIQTEFESGGRHSRRVGKITRLESEQDCT
jgi:ribose 5-phosphate isomerase B